MLETDAPYLLPRSIKPTPKDRRNMPEFLPVVLAAVAQARGQDPAHVARISRENARRFFALSEPLSARPTPLEALFPGLARFAVGTT